MPELVGIGILFAAAALIVKIGVIVYFFVLLQRITGAVNRIEQRCTGIEAEVRSLPH